jgi:hypothetical protein
MSKRGREAEPLSHKRTYSDPGEQRSWDLDKSSIARRFGVA